MPFKMKACLIFYLCIPQYWSVHESSYHVYLRLSVILEMDVDSIRAKYPHWTDEMVLDLKAQFQSFDLNLDGLIDFNEL